eukprot:12355023-Alexandrium_andersonii.AAC.1
MPEIVEPAPVAPPEPAPTDIAAKARTTAPEIDTLRGALTKVSTQIEEQEEFLRLAEEELAGARQAKARLEEKLQVAIATLAECAGPSAK